MDENNPMRAKLVAEQNETARRMTAPDSRDSVELLPCPFCGSAAERYEYDNHDGSHWHYCVMCSNTDCPIVEMRAEEDTQEAADAVWNNRQALARGPQQAGGEDAKDAARYRWLRSLDGTCDAAACVNFNIGFDWLEQHGDDLDAAIDAAIGGTGDA